MDVLWAALRAAQKVVQKVLRTAVWWVGSSAGLMADLMAAQLVVMWADWLAA